MAIVVVDAGIVIGALDPGDAHHDSASAALLRREDEDLCLPASALAEALVGQVSGGLVETVRARIERTMRVVPIDVDVAAEAARVRSRTGLPLPDALVLATAEVLDADVILTTDRRWRNLPRVQVV